MAQKLHDQYDYSFDNLKVLEGGWGTWNDRHNADPNGYPTATGGSVPANPDPNKIVVTPAP